MIVIIVRDEGNNNQEDARSLLPFAKINQLACRIDGDPQNILIRRPRTAQN